MATKITLRPEGATDNSQDVVLADGADRSADNVRGPAAGTISVAIASQQFNAIRATNARVIHRGNRAGTYSFEASRNFASPADAGRFMLTHGMSCPASGTLIFDFGDTAATPAGKLGVLFGCVIRRIGLPRQVGVHVATSYDVAFGSADEIAPANLAAQIIARRLVVSEPAVPYALRINCGGWLLKNTDWVADAYFDDDSEASGETTVIEVAKDTPEAVYFAWRQGAAVEYEIPLPAGTYDVKLHFIELVYSDPAERLMDIAINEVLAFEDFDIFVEADGRGKSLVAGVDAVEVADTLTINLTATVGQAMLAGIEILEHDDTPIPDEEPEE